MSIREQVWLQGMEKSAFMPCALDILQRKCTCGQHTIAGGECNEVNESGTVYNVLDPGARETADIETISYYELQNHTAGFWIIDRI
jgi:hypothetical protein